MPSSCKVWPSSGAESAKVMRTRSAVTRAPSGGKCEVTTGVRPGPAGTQPPGGP